jgi:hypothetical protein
MGPAPAAQRTSLSFSSGNPIFGSRIDACAVQDDLDHQTSEKRRNTKALIHLYYLEKVDYESEGRTFESFRARHFATTPE